MEEHGLKRDLIDASASAISGGISRTVTSPLDVIKIRFQVQLEPTIHWALLRKEAYSRSKYRSMLQATTEIFREEGLQKPSARPGIIMPSSSWKMNLHSVCHFSSRPQPAKADKKMLNCLHAYCLDKYKTSLICPYQRIWKCRILPVYTRICSWSISFYSTEREEGYHVTFVGSTG